MDKPEYPRLPEESNYQRTSVYMDKFGVSGLREFVRVNFVRSMGELELHLHSDAIELCYIAKGQQIYCVEDKEYKIRKDMVFVSHPNELHHSSEYRQERGVQLYYMIIDVINDTDRFLGMSGSDAVELAEEMKNLPYTFTAGPEIRNLFEEMFRLYFDRPPYWQTQLKCTAFRLCRELVMYARKERTEKQVSVEILRALNYIEDHLSDHKEISIEDMADMAYLSLPQFNARFIREIGASPRKYINRRRMELACDMLKIGMRITDTSYELGFSSTQHFSNMFRSYYGMSPSKWRCRMVKDQDLKDQ